MDSKLEDQKVNINFESHPPISEDLNGVATLIRQTLLQFVDCYAIADYLISLEDITQVIAQEGPEEENVNEDDDPDDDIYGVVSIIDLSTSDKPPHSETRRQLLKFLEDKCSKLKKELDADSEHKSKHAMVINERYINLPPQLALPTLKALTSHLEDSGYTHLIFVSKILVRARNSETELPSKKVKSAKASSSKRNETLIFVNPEEEIIFENCEYYADLDVSAHCDENATWSFSSDINYIPHRRIMIIDFKKWPKILASLDEELK